MRYPSFIGGAYKASNPRAANELCINLYPEPIQSSATTNDWQLVPTPGVQAHSASATGVAPGRAFAVFNGRAYAVIGTEFIELLAGAVRVLRGTILSDDGYATLSYNGSGGHQVFITSAGRAWCYDTESHAFTLVTLPGQASAAVMLAGYTFMLDRTTSTIYQSGLLNSLSFNAISSAKRIVAGNPWRQVAVLGKQLFLLGELTSEVWYVADTYPFALVPHPSGEIPTGIAANDSVAAVGVGLFWLAQSASIRGVVVSASGFQPTIVSDFAMQAAIGGYSRIDDAVGYGVDDRAGHEFYVLTFPTAGTSWVYDLSTRRWHERRLWISQSAQWQAWRPVFSVHFSGLSLTLDRLGSDVLVLTPTGGTDLDRPIRRIRRAPYILDELRLLFVSRFWLLMKTGQGLSTGVGGNPLNPDGQGVNPLISLNVSTDGGNTWWSAGDVSSGRQGEYSYYPEWTRLGAGESFVFEIDMTDPVPWSIVDAFVEVT